MEIICPQCGFSRTVADDKVPAKSVFATCPKCRFKFRFRSLEEPEYEFEAEEETPPPAPPLQRPAPAPHQPAPAMQRPAPAPQRPAPAPQPSAPAPQPPAPARAQAAPPQQPAAAVPPEPAAPPAPPAPPQPDNRPVRRIVLRDEYADEPTAHGPEQDPAEPSRPGDIWQKLENLAREESSRAETGELPGIAGIRSDVPWENLAEHGFFRGLWATIAAATFRPREFFRTMPTGGGIAKPVSFYILLSMFSTAAQTVWFGLFLDTLSQIIAIPPEIAQYLRFNLVQDIVGIAVLTPAVSILRIFLFSGLMHLGLRTMNSAAGGFNGTLRAIAYTNATSIFNLVPLVGMFIDLFWWMAVFLIALKETHRSTFGRVILAIHLPLVVVILAMYVASRLPGGA